MSDDLKNALAEKAFHIQVSRLWAAAYKAGYPHEQVKAFSFVPGFLTRYETRDNRQAAKQGKNPPFSDAKYHNAVRLSSGEVVEIPLTPRPQTPPHMRCTTSKPAHNLTA